MAHRDIWTPLDDPDDWTTALCVDEKVNHPETDPPAFSLLVCRDIPEDTTDENPAWLADLGDNKYAELRFATESERTQVAMEALNLGYRVQFTTISEFEDESGVADIKRLCAAYYGDSGATNPTSHAEYESAVAGQLISALEEAYQFES